MTPARRSTSVPAFFKKRTSRGRRIARLKREIALLESMDQRLFRDALVTGLIAIALMAAAFGMAAWKFEIAGWHPLLTAAVCIAAASLAWWIGRYTIYIPVVAFMLAVSVLIEDDPGFVHLPEPAGGGKQSRQRKLETALRKRRILLDSLEKQP
jgi:hypothetical protein